MPIFQKSIVDKYLKTLDEGIIDQAYESYKEVYSSKKIQRIKKLKEEQYQSGFLNDIFGSVLGYTIDPEVGYNIELEKKNETDSKKADGAILKEENVLGVIELKSNKTKNLESIKDQAFGYKNNHKGCKYVISSNFHKLRFYVDDATEYEEFDLYNLNKEEFKKFYLYLRKEGLLDKNIPKLLKEETKFHEENISKQLYKDYSVFKNKFFENIVKNNPQHDKLLLFKKSQKFLDRILFILFAEDKNLIPTNAISRIVESWVLADDLHYKPLYELFNILFEHLNVGHKYKSGYELPAYNGGLFAPDDVLDNLKVDDDILKDDLLILSKYDFNTEVDVNILGHIFEHSLTEIEEIEAKLKGEEADKSKGKRKKDGVFYTPKYITKYIVDNTVGRLCTEKKEELGLNIDFDFQDYQKSNGSVNAKGKELFHNLESYKEWLLQLKILDPACGSGAFLNQALYFLIEEHKFIDDLIAELTNSPLRIFDTDKTILENNIYGVDINEESVEIAKLSLWLRTAQKGRKLSNLNNNIKCGNSLIDDVEVAGDKAFKWEAEFPEIFANGGFDVVIGNPPYVVLSSFEGPEFNFLQDSYETAYGRLNLFSLFIEKCTQIIKTNATVGLIIPDSLCLIDYYSKLRKLLLDHFTINQLLELGDGVFDDATVPALILLFENKKPLNNLIYTGTNKNVLLGDEKPSFIKQDFYYSTPKNSFNLYADEIFVKLNRMIESDSAYALKDVLQIKIGVCTGGNKKHLNVDPIYSNSKKVLQGKDINRYKLSWGEMYINYSKSELLRSRDEAIFLKEEKLLMRQTSDKLILSYDNEKYYTIDSLFILYLKDEGLNIKYCLALLNSKLLNRQYQKLNPETGRVFAQVKIDYVNEIPIIKPDVDTQNKYVLQVDLLIDRCKELDKLELRFIKYITTQFSIEKLPKKIQNWPELEFGDFIKELNKVIKKSGGEKLTKMNEMEWMEVFETKKEEAQKLKAEIDKTDKEIDQMVYELYGLTEDEIKIVEES